MKIKSNLKKVIGRNSFCGPAALSAVFGIPTHDASRYVREANGKTYAIRGMYHSEMLKTLDAHDIKYSYRKYKKNERLTINKLLPELPAGLFIISASKHFIAYDSQTKTFADSGTYKAKKPLPIDKHPHPRAKVVAVFHIKGGAILALPKTAPKIIGKPASFKQVFDAYSTTGLKDDYVYATDSIYEKVGSETAAHDMDDDYYLTVDRDNPESVHAAAIHYLGCDDEPSAIMKAIINDAICFDIEMLPAKDYEALKTIRLIAGKHNL